MINPLDSIRADLSAFADEPEDLLIQPNGQALFVHAGTEISCRFQIVDGAVQVELDGKVLPYRQFLIRHVAQLDVFAERLLTRRPPVDIYVDGNAVLDSNSRGRIQGNALGLLREESTAPASFMATVTFITADAGHGKTVLLRQFQAEQAQRFLRNESTYLFWHVDLQGRKLLRLHEALMGDLGELRIPGLWMAAVVRLLRHQALVLAIDGFDELAAEQGSAEALGALALLVRQLEGQGRIIAASRRTFFDSDDYLRRTRMLKQVVLEPCEFNQVQLLPWGRPEAITYLEQTQHHGPLKSTPSRIYADLLSILGGEASHPMLTRPFLFTHIVRGLQAFDTTPKKFLRPLSEPDSGVKQVVEAFVRREVQDKWRDRETGEPYLTFDQHMSFLAAVADEMYRSQKDRLEVDVLQLIATLLLDSWSINPGRRAQIIEMVRMHVLLTKPADGQDSARSFDHPEFREYFVAYALREHLERVASGESAVDLAAHLSIAQISDSAARYVCAMISRDEVSVRRLVEGISRTVRDEKRLTFLQMNVGTLMPFLLSGVIFSEPLVVDCPLMFSSVVFEGQALAGVEFRSATAVNASLVGAEWRNIAFRDARLGELTIGPTSLFESVVFENCEVTGLRVTQVDDDPIREYAPLRINAMLAEVGISMITAGGQPADREEHPDSHFSRVVHRTLRLFFRSTYITEAIVQIKMRQDQHLVIEEVVPLLERHGIIGETAWRGAGQQKAWALLVLLDGVMASEADRRGEFAAFWTEVLSRR